MKVLCVRTEMCGGGTSYDVYVRRKDKLYHPIAAGCFATVICRDGGEYFHLDDYLRTPEVDALPPLTDERWTAFKHIEPVAKRLEARIASRAFPELRGTQKLPLLWARWTLPSAETWVDVGLPAL